MLTRNKHSCHTCRDVNYVHHLNGKVKLTLKPPPPPPKPIYMLRWLIFYLFLVKKCISKC